ncbi:hypothetical protein MSG28_007057 [Choristoneura fumiferana]|uniref:Uncharacterized protein n=2 Tax=Choristoneura fumiferana TaxID=7141 RepID=A0ACC0JN26_CHOFU|nr:hypothetical protein MSG28_007057 [Choristoneura fumiferana]
MRLKVINWIFLTCLATALTSESEPRPRRHLYDMKQMLAYKLFTRNEPNCTRYQPPGTRFFRIPGFNDVVVKAVPKSFVTPAPIIEKIPPNPHLSVVGSYLGTDSIDETYNALLGANNLFKTGILEANDMALHKLSPLRPIARKPVTLCLNPKPVHPSTVESVASEAVPTRYSYKQINQDGSVTTWSSYLDFNQGVKVTEGGKTLPFVIDRIRKIPVQFPVPVLPEVSKTLNPYDANFGHYYPVKVNQPDSYYSYQQMNHDGRLTAHTGLPSSYNKYGSQVVVTDAENTPPPPFFFENVPMSTLYPKAPLLDIIGPKPLAFDVPAGHVIYDAPVFENPLLAPGYSYTQIHGSDGMTTAHEAAASSAPPISLFPRIHERNPFAPPAYQFIPYSYNQDHSGVRVENYAGTHGWDFKEHEEDFSATEPLTFGVQPPSPYSFSDKQNSSDGKVTYYNGAQKNMQPAIADRKENATAGSKVNGIYASTLPLVNRFTYPVPNSFVKIPSVESNAPQKPIKPPSASGTSSFLYKHVHRDGSVTSYGEEGSNDHKPNPAMPTVQGNTRVFESPIYTGPFPIDVNTNAYKPSSPVSGLFSYKLLNNGQVDYHYAIGRNEVSLTPELEGNEPFPVSSLHRVSAAPVTGYVESDSKYSPDPAFGQSSSLNQGGIPQRYSYTHTGYPQPNPFLTVNADNPVIATNNQQQYYTNEFQNYNGDFYPNSDDYVYIPPARYDEISSPVKPFNFSRLPPKKFSNRFVYENVDGVNTRDENFYLPSSTPKPQESSAHNFYDKESLAQVRYNRKSFLSNRNSVTNNFVVTPELVSTPKPADTVYVKQAPVQVPLNFQPSLGNRNNYPMVAPEQVSIPNSPLNSVHNEQNVIEILSSPQSSVNHSSLNANPITVQKTSFLFKQSNADGSSITTTNDGNTMSVQVEEARQPAAVQDEQSNEEETPRAVDETPKNIPVPVVVEEAARPEPVQVPS